MPHSGSHLRRTILTTSGINLILLTFLIISFIIGAIAVVREESFDTRQRAYMGDYLPPDNQVSKPAPTPTPVINSVAAPPPKDSGNETARLAPINTGGTTSAPNNKEPNSVYKPPLNTGTGGSVAGPTQGNVTNSTSSQSHTNLATSEVSRDTFDKLAEGQSKPGQRANTSSTFGNVSTFAVHPVPQITISTNSTSNANTKTAIESASVAAKALSFSSGGVQNASITISNQTSGPTKNGVSVTSDLKGKVIVAVNSTAKPAEVEQEVVKQTFGVLALQKVSTPNSRVQSEYCPTSSKVCSPMEAYVTAANQASNTTVNDRGESTAKNGSTQKAKIVTTSFVDAAGNYAVNSSNNSPEVNKVMADILGSTYAADQTGSVDGSSIKSITVSQNSSQKSAYLCSTFESCMESTSCLNSGKQVTSLCYKDQPGQGYCCR